MITTVSETFYRSLTPLPELKSIDDFGLDVYAADGAELPYMGYIEACIGTQFLDHHIDVPVLVVPTTDHGLSVPVVIGTNVLRLCQEQCEDTTDIPKPWKTAFMSIHEGYIGKVKSTNQRPIEVQPFETVTIPGLTRKLRNTEAAVTEATESASTRIGVCPRVVTLDKIGRNQRIPVRIFNMSAKAITIKPQTMLCQLQEVKLLRHMDAPATEKESTARVSSQTVGAANSDDITLPTDITLDGADLTSDQKSRLGGLLMKWESIFSTGTTDIGHTKLVEHHIKLSDDAPFKEPHDAFHLDSSKRSENT